MNKMKCSLCGCTGIHACTGDLSKIKKTVDMSLYSKYNTIEEAIDHIRRSEAEQRKSRREDHRHDRNSRRS